MRALRGAVVTLAGVIGMTMGVGLLAPAPALAAEGTEAPAAAADVAKEASPGLPVRPSRPLVLNQEAPSSGWGFKAFAMAVVAGGAYVVWKRKKTMARPGQDPQVLRVVRRASVGVRSELVVVEVEGKRLFLGVTPNSINTLAVLADEDEALVTAPEDTAAAEEALQETPRSARPLALSAPNARKTGDEDYVVPMQTDFLSRLSNVMKTADLSGMKTRASSNETSAEESAVQEAAPRPAPSKTRARAAKPSELDVPSSDAVVKAPSSAPRTRTRTAKAQTARTAAPLEGQGAGLAALRNVR